MYCTTKFNKSQPKKTLCPGDDLLSPTLTTIGPCRLNDRVRDGNGCGPAGSVTKTKSPFGIFMGIETT